MAHFEGLEGVEGGELEGPIVMGGRAAMKALTRHRIVSGCGDNGAWTVWQDDKGAYRCDFCRHRKTINAAVFTSKSKVLDWLKEYIPQCHEETATLE